MTTDHLLTALASTLLLAGCGADDSDTVPSESVTSSATVAALLGDANDLSQVSDALGDVGLQSVFDGNAPYSIFAPTDAAFGALDLPLDGDDMRAARVAVIREHIVPGYLTRDDIEEAIASNGGSVELQTMGSNTLTFTDEADGLVITSSDGARAHLAGTVQSGVNGTIFPVDAVLKSVRPAF